MERPPITRLPDGLGAAWLVVVCLSVLLSIWGKTFWAVIGLGVAFEIGKLSAVPRVRLKEDEVIWLNLDHRAGFMLAQIDGTLSFEDLFSVSGMSRLDTARILAQLLDQRVIVSERP